MQQESQPVSARKSGVEARSGGPDRARRHEAGAVSLMWVIVIVVLWLATAGVWYGSLQDSARANERIARLNTSVAAAEARLEEAVDSRALISRSVGYRDESVVGSTTDVEAVMLDMAGLRADLGLAEGQGAQTLAGLVAALRDSHRSKNQQLAAARSDFEREVAARRAAEAAANSVETSFRSQLDTLTQELADERRRADSQSRTDERRLADLLASQEAADAAARNAQQALADLEVRSRRDLARNEAQLRALAEHPTVETGETVDGRLLAVGSGAATAYVDIGSRDGLKAGTRFELLRTSRTGELLPRGTVEVRSVEQDMALVALVGDVDLYDPMLPGDLVRSPFFERGRSRAYFLLGEFPLALSREFVSARLKELGQKVHERVDVTTDVLVLGEPPLAEGDDAPPLLDTEEFKLAERLGLRIMRLAELREYLSL